MQAILILLIVVAVLGGGYFWYSSSVQAPQASTGSVNTNQMPIVESPSTPEKSVEAIEVKEFAFTNSGLKFDKSTFAVKKGDRVKVTYTNAGGTHDFRIDGYNVGTKVLSNGASESFEFVADKAGAFEFYCSVGSHRAMGMKGTFTVTP